MVYICFEHWDQDKLLCRKQKAQVFESCEIATGFFRGWWEEEAFRHFPSLSEMPGGKGSSEFSFL